MAADGVHSDGSRAWHAYDLYLTVNPTDVPTASLDGLDLLKRDPDDLLALCGKACEGTDASGQCFELIVEPFLLSIRVWPEEDEDGYVDEMLDKARRWHLQFVEIGSILLCSHL